MTKAKIFIGLLVCFAVAFTAATLGSIASIRAAEFYQQLSRPSWAPPGRVFGPVWTLLYCAMALASWLVWKTNSPQRSGALAAYLLQLALNALWSWLFFAWRLGQWAFIEVLVLWIAIALTMILFWRIHRLAALLLLPYFLWVTYASCLTHAVWRQNPDLLS